jgi:hypothetical protein
MGASMPSITPESLIAVVAGAVGILVSLTIIDNETAQGIVASLSAIVPAVFNLWHMATVRGNRAKAIAAGAKVVDGKLAPPS